MKIQNPKRIKILVMKTRAREFFKVRECLKGINSYSGWKITKLSSKKNIVDKGNNVILQYYVL